MRGSMSLAALAAVITSASGAIIPLAEMNEIRASASATAPVQAVEKEATPANAKGTVPAWFQELLAGSATISSSSSTISTQGTVTPPGVTPSTLATSPLIPSPSVPSASPVTSELTLAPVPTPS